MNPFSEALALSGDAQQALYAKNRDARQSAQAALLVSDPVFQRDNILANLVADQAYNDPRHSIIFIARPKTILAAVTALQEGIIAVLVRHGVSTASIWTTPAEHLHMTILDVISCVSADQVATIKPQVRGAMTNSIEGQCTLRYPKLMVDGTAMALSFLPDGQTPDDSHVKMRSDLWTAADRNGTTPVMRYVAHSAHVTLIRFVEDVILSSKVMQDILQELQGLTLSGLQEWVITKEDVLCVYGQVYYGGGTVTH